MTDRKPLVQVSGDIREIATGDTVPVANGGTGATAAAGARTNLDVPGLSTDNTLTGIQTVTSGTADSMVRLTRTGTGGGAVTVTGSDTTTTSFGTVGPGSSNFYVSASSASSPTTNPYLWSNTSGVRLRSNAVFGWSNSTTNASSTLDTSFSRLAPGSIGTTGKLTVTADAAATVPLLVKGAASQSGNHLEVQNSSSTILTKFDSAGWLGIGLGATAVAAPIHVSRSVFNMARFERTGAGGAGFTCVESGGSAVNFGVAGGSANFFAGVDGGSDNFLYADTSSLNVKSGQSIGWVSSSTTAVGTPDTSFTRLSAGAIGTTSSFTVTNTANATVTPIKAVNTSTGSSNQTRIQIQNDGGTTSTDGVMLYLNGANNADPHAFGVYSYESGRFVVGVNAAVQMDVNSSGLCRVKGFQAGESVTTPAYLAGTTAGTMNVWKESGGAAVTCTTLSTSARGAVTVARARGTAASPTALQNGDAIGDFQFIAYDGAGTQQLSTYIGGVVDGSVSAAVTPISMIFVTGSNLATRATRMSISSAGQVAVTNNGATSLVPFLVRGVASQSGSLQEWQNSSSTVLASVDSAGVGSFVTPGFSAHKNGSAQTSISPSTWTKITFGTEEWDTGGYYDTANSRFTPLKAGKYLITATVYWSANVVDGQEYLIAAYKNGTAFKKAYDVGGGLGFSPCQTLSCLVSLNGSTDYVEIYGYGAGTGNKSISGDSTLTYFQALYTGP